VAESEKGGGEKTKSTKRRSQPSSGDRKDRLKQKENRPNPTCGKEQNQSNGSVASGDDEARKRSVGLQKKREKIIKQVPNLEDPRG